MLCVLRLHYPVRRTGRKDFTEPMATIPPDGVRTSRTPASAVDPIDTCAECLLESYDRYKAWGHSQHGEDLVLLPTLARIAEQARIDGRTPVFVEIGGHDGVTISNTVVLERCCGWRGVLVEPHPANFATMNRSRPLAANVHAGVCADAPYGAPGAMLHLQGRGPVARAGGGCGAIAVPCRSLTSIIRNAGYDAVDFLSLDVQGSEADVLAHTDLSLIQGVALVEMEDPKSAAAAQVHEVLSKAGLHWQPSLQVPISRVYTSRNVQIRAFPNSSCIGADYMGRLRPKITLDASKLAAMTRGVEGRPCSSTTRLRGRKHNPAHG